METKEIPTHDEIRATFAEVREQLERSHLCLDATIDDYPIGRRERGKCRLQVERVASEGYRTVRTTTNKHGRWCKPHKSTYSNSLIVVVRDWDTEHQHAWLSRGNPRAEYGGAHLCVQYANGAGIALAKCWRNDAPRREDLHYTSVIRTSKLGITADGLLPENMTEERQEHVLQADSVAECDAWDVWVTELETGDQGQDQGHAFQGGPRTCVSFGLPRKKLVTRSDPCETPAMRRDLPGGCRGGGGGQSG